MRNGVGAHRFMMEFLNFPDEASAKAVRDEYFERYHATAKGLQVAEREGRFPDPDPTKPQQNKSPRFQPADLAEYWASKLDFGLLGGAKTEVVKDLQALSKRSHLGGLFERTAQVRTTRAGRTRNVGHCLSSGHTVCRGRRVAALQAGKGGL